jgi:hypothetical protein
MNLVRHSSECGKVLAGREPQYGKYYSARYCAIPADANTLTENQTCHKKPRSGKSLYCGESCLRADISTIPPLCPVCNIMSILSLILTISSNAADVRKLVNSGIVERLVGKQLRDEA